MVKLLFSPLLCHAFAAPQLATDQPSFSIYPSVGSFYLLVKPKIIYFLFCSNSCRDRRVRISTSMIQWFGLQKSNLLYQPIFRGYTRVDCKLIGLMEFHLKFFKLWMNIKIHGVIVTFLKSCKHFFNCNFDILITNQTYKISDRLSTMAEVRQKRTIPLKKPLRLNVSVIVNQAMILPKIIVLILTEQYLPMPATYRSRNNTYM